MKFNYLLIAALLFAAGCKDDDPATDETKPTITSINFLDGASVRAGDSLNLRVTFEDDMELSEAFIEVHENFEGHKHGKVNQKFSDSKILTLSGTNSEQYVSFEIPSNAAAGPYHIEVSALDGTGNRSDTKVFEMTILQDDQPTFKSFPTSLTVSPNSTFNVTFEVEDDTDIKEISYILLDHNDPSAPALADGDIDLDGPDDLSFAFDQSFSAGNVLTTLEFVVRALDSDENMTVAEIEIDVQ